MELQQAMRARRSRYELENRSPISSAAIETLVQDALTLTPSAFHSQSARAVLLFGDRHQRLWDIVRETLRARVPAEKFASTDAKINGFATGFGTILFLEDQDTVAGLQKSFPSYAENFPLWSQQSSGMLQYAIWVRLADQGLGASLQHYNPLIDDQITKEFGLPAQWKLLAQMPFGTPLDTPQPLSYIPLENRFITQGGH